MVLLCGVAGMRHADAGGFGKNLRTWVPTSNLGHSKHNNHDSHITLLKQYYCWKTTTLSDAIQLAPVTLLFSSKIYLNGLSEPFF